MRNERFGWANGIFFELGDSSLLLDPTSGRPLRHSHNVFITHAHSDHTYGFSTSAKKYCTEETLRVYEALRERKVSNCETIRIGETVKIGDFQVKALNAGHMMGSCQFQVTTPKSTVIYTGDINCVDTLTTQAAEEMSCDYLIIEATYGHPSYLFPQRSTMYADMVRWAVTEIGNGKIPTFQVYSSGKPQEVVRLFNVYTKIPVVCTPSIARANSVHNESGIKLDYVDASTSEGKHELKAGGCIYVTSSGSDHLPKNPSRAVATGWALREAYRKYASFPLSSHADYDQLMRFVATANPKIVYIFTGYTDILAGEIERKLGIKAGPLPVLSQTKLLDFREMIT